jgi:hypothetical protein
MQDVGNVADREIEAELNVLPLLSIEKLRVRWRGFFGKAPPPAFGPDLLRRSIAFRLQEKVFGGFGESDRRDLDLLVRATSKTSGGRIKLPRRIKIGAVLVREWMGSTYRVTVVDEGFIYDKQKYKSLSEIARKITGARWNGPRFFGLRNSIPSSKSELKTHAIDVRAGVS